MRVGVAPTPWAVFRSGARIWTHLAEHLASLDGVEIVEDAPDVWAWNGYEQPMPPDGVLVANLHEAPWGDPELRTGVSPELVAFGETAGEAVARRATRIFTGSESSRRQIADYHGFDIDRIDVAPYGVDTTVFRPDGPRWPIEGPYVLYVGSVLPRKNLPVLRAAMCQLDFPHRLVLVTSPAPDRLDSSDLLAAAEEPLPGGRELVNLAGVDDEGLAALMRGADVLCLPSLAEGFGLPVVEAMACGTPVLVSDRTSLPEVAGDGGLVVEPTVDGVSAGLERLLGDEKLRRELGRQAAARGATFTWRRCAEAVHRSLLAALDG
jgi:glycosyltransferase involved in cell wall biosynthesis